jgi:hypothetical protein
MGKLILVGDLKAPVAKVRGRTAIYARVFLPTRGLISTAKSPG